uniref:Uncharacterized protein n=1 Tax=Oryza glumipatula TaxID=40148 RepID=A0A0E0AGA3_9ORYZ
MEEENYTNRRLSSALGPRSTCSTRTVGRLVFPCPRYQLADYLHVFQLAPLLVYDIFIGTTGYYAQWCHTLGIGSQGTFIPVWMV